MHTLTSTIALAAAAAACALPGHASATADRIEDNSFLIEEAYNQEPGVLHHISTFQRSSTTGQWLYAYTEEWPIGGQTHQVSATLPLARAEVQARTASGLGDVSLHYRYAIFQEEEAPQVVVVRGSLLLPTGDRKRGLGEGRPGGQLAVPLSVKLGERFVDHGNVYGTWFPPSERARDTCVGWGVGDGLVWLARPSFNLMLEALWTQTDRAAGATSTRTRTLTVNPAFRSSIDFESGLQIVWGLGAPMGLGPSRGDRGVFLYLSFEHPLTSRSSSTR
jgi:hypothetical protein